MFKINWSSIGIAGSLATVDVISMPIIKCVARHGWNIRYLLIPIVLYAINPIIFYFGMKTETMVVMNMLWDMLSDILVSGVGLFVMGEKLSSSKLLGLCLSFVSIILLSIDTGKLKDEKSICN
jgi:multidrug transporter EmrE-like cation transporter